MYSILAISGTVLLTLCSQVLGRPQQNSLTQQASGNVTLVKNDVLPLDGKGTYSYDIQLSDGTKLIQSGRTEPPTMGDTSPSLVIEGSYSYLAPDGKQILVTYVADKTGFHPHIDGASNQGAEVSVPQSAGK